MKDWTWPRIVRQALTQLTRVKGKASLRELYSVIERHPRARSGVNRNVRAKVRQVLQASEEYVLVDRGVWALASKFSEEQLAQLRDLSKTRYPQFKKRS